MSLLAPGATSVRQHSQPVCGTPPGPLPSLIARPCHAILLALLLASPARAAQDPGPPPATLAGTVVDASNRNRLAGVIVALVDRNFATVSDSLGEFRISGVPAGVHRFAFGKYGYRDVTVLLTVADPPLSVEIALTPDPLLLDSLDVVADRTITVRGAVVDASTGVRLRGAAVLLASNNRGVVTDSSGTFTLNGLPAGDHLLLVRQFGYESLYVPVRATASHAFIEVPLPPAPMLLEGLTVEVMAANVGTMDQRIRSRRNAAAVNVRALDQDRLLRSAASNLLEFLEFEAFLHPIGCTGSGFISNRCIMRRGRMTEPNVFIDEVPAFAGLDQLATYRPHDLYLVEVWSSGATIRAYTHQFMERMARRPIMLLYSW